MNYFLLNAGFLCPSRVHVQGIRVPMIFQDNIRSLLSMPVSCFLTFFNFSIFLWLSFSSLIIYFLCFGLLESCKLFCICQHFIQCPSVEETTIKYYHADLFCIANIFQRVSIEQEQIGNFPFLYCSDIC